MEGESLPTSCVLITIWHANDYTSTHRKYMEKVLISVPSLCLNPNRLWIETYSIFKQGQHAKVTSLHTTKNCWTSLKYAFSLYLNRNLMSFSAHRERQREMFQTSLRLLLFSLWPMSFRSPSSYNFHPMIWPDPPTIFRCFPH